MGCSCLTTPVLGRVKASPLKHQLFSSPEGSSSLGRLLAHPGISTYEAANQTNPFLLSARQHPRPTWKPGFSAPAPRARGSGRCRCIRGGPNCSAPGAPPAGTCPQHHPWGEVGWGEEKPEPLRALEGSETPRDPISFLGSGVPRARLTYLQVKRLDGVTVVVVGELPEEKALLLSLLLQALERGREAERENRGAIREGDRRR